MTYVYSVNTTCLCFDVFLSYLTLLLLNSDILYFENTVDPDQLASDEAS